MEIEVKSLFCTNKVIEFSKVFVCVASRFGSISKITEFLAIFVHIYYDMVFIFMM